MSHLISIIIPAYNAENFLESCLLSLTMQTFQKLEIIVVNDGSTDKKVEIAVNWARKDTRILVINQQNEGVSAARNAGLDIAKGNFIGFIDADDELELDMYEFLFQNLKKYNADISHCGFELVRKDRTIQFHNTKIVLVQNRVEALNEFLSGARIEPSACTKLFKKEILKNVRFANNFKLNEDLLFNIEAFKNAERTVFEDVIKYKYKYNSQSASHSTNILFIQEEIYKAAQKIRLLLQDDNMKDSAEKFYVVKLITSLKSLKKHHLFSTDLVRDLREELKASKTTKLGLRISVLKNLLVYFPSLYDVFIYFYNLLFAKNQKWNDD